MVSRVRHFLLGALISTCVVACSSDKRTVEMHITEGDVWDSVEEFYYDNSDTLSLREIAICLR